MEKSIFIDVEIIIANKHRMKTFVGGCFWLFAQKFWEVVGTYKLSFCSKRNAASVVLTMWGDGDTETLLGDKKKFELYAFSGYKNFPISPSSWALAPYTSQLVKLSQPNCWLVRVS